MTKDHERVVRVRVRCVQPPECGVGQRFGLQNPDLSVIAGLPQPDGSLLFECDLRVRRSASGAPNFLGAFTHGTPTDRFLYLTMRDDQQIRWRIKVKLASITWEQVEAVAQGGVLEASVERRRAGTVPLLGAGWQIKNPP